MQVQDAYRTQQLYACRLSLPKHGINSEFVHFMNQDNEIVAEHFAQGLVDHSYVRLAAKAISEFPFHHAKRRFDVAAFVVVLQELRAPERKVMVHLLPRSPAVASVMGCEGDKRRGSRVGDGRGIRLTGIPLVRRDFGHLEILRGSFYHSGEQRRIVSVPVVNLHSRYNVRLDSAHEMALHPIVVLSHLPVLVVKPANETRGSEAGRIHCEVCLDGTEGQAALRDEFLQDGSQVGILKVIENRIVVGSLGDETIRFRSAKIGHKAASRNGGIDLERRAENRVRDWQAGASHLAFLGLGDATAEISEQSLEFVFFVGLRCVVSGPILRVGGALRGCRDRQSLRHGGAAIGIMFASHSVRDRKNMLAADASRLEIGTGASRKFRHHVYSIRSFASLRRDNPQISLVVNRPSGCDFETALLSGVHDLRSQSHYAVYYQ